MGQSFQSCMHLFQIPGFMEEDLDYFFTSRDFRLIRTLGEESLSLSALSDRLTMTKDEAQRMLEKAYQQHLLEREERDEEVLFSLSDFYTKLDYHCKFDDQYDRIPAKIREQLDIWCYEEYKERTKDYIEGVVRGEEVEEEPETYLLLSQLNSFLQEAERIRVVPCNCRSLKGACDHPVETCLLFDDAIDDRTGGREITKMEAEKLVRDLDARGLMHQVNSDWPDNGPHWMCNCCSCCCYPKRLSDDLGTEGLWPKRSNLASYHASRCVHCGLCLQRCPSGALDTDQKMITLQGREKERVEYHPELCLGCGLCVNTCPEEAITMEETILGRANN